MAWQRRCYEDFEQKDDLVNELFNHDGIRRTAPAGPSLLKMSTYTFYLMVLIRTYGPVHLGELSGLAIWAAACLLIRPELHMDQTKTFSSSTQYVQVPVYAVGPQAHR